MNRRTSPHHSVVHEEDGEDDDSDVDGHHAGGKDAYGSVEGAYAELKDIEMSHDPSSRPFRNGSTVFRGVSSREDPAVENSPEIDSDEALRIIRANNLDALLPTDDDSKVQI